MGDIFERYLDGLQQTEIELTKDNAGPKRKVKMISDIVKQRQATLLGHVIICEKRDPMKMVSFENEELAIGGHTTTSWQTSKEMDS